MSLTLLMNTGQLFCKKSLNFGLSGILSWLYGGYEFQQEYHGSDIEVILPFLSTSPQGVVMSIYLITGDVNLHHFVKEMSASLLKLLFISFATDQNLEEILWDYTNILLLFKHSFKDSSICWWIMPTTIIPWFFSNHDFVFHSSFIHSIHSTMDSWILILFYELYPITIIIYFIVYIVQDLIILHFYMLAPMTFWHALIIF